MSSFSVAAAQLSFREEKRQKLESTFMPLIFFLQYTFNSRYFPGCHARMNYFVANFDVRTLGGVSIGSVDAIVGAIKGVVVSGWIQSKPSFRLAKASASIVGRSSPSSGRIRSKFIPGSCNWKHTKQLLVIFSSYSDKRCKSLNLSAKLQILLSSSRTEAIWARKAFKKQWCEDENNM